MAWIKMAVVMALYLAFLVWIESWWGLLVVPFLYDGPQEVFWFAFAIAAISGTAFSIVALLVYLPIFLPLGKWQNK